MLYAAKKLEEIKSIEMFFVHGRYHDENNGIGSLIGGDLEPSFSSFTFKDGIYIKEKLKR